MTSAKIRLLCFSAVRQRDEWERRRKMKVKRERGWTGNSWGGISLGPPDPGPNGGKSYLNAHKVLLLYRYTVKINQLCSKSISTGNPFVILIMLYRAIYHFDSQVNLLTAKERSEVNDI